MSPLIFKMATIHNTDLTKELKEGAKLQQLRDVIPSQLADKVVPVMEVNPKMFRIVNYNVAGAGTNSTSTSLGTTPTDRDTFITGATLSFFKDITATTTFIRLNATMENGLGIVLCSFGCVTLNIDGDAMTISFPNPVKLKRGSAITISASTNVGNFNAFGSVMGYQVENILA